MLIKIIEATNHELNWGKFCVMRPDSEWERRSALPGCETGTPLLSRIGWQKEHVWVLDLQTGEGACFRPGGFAKADLDKHRIWVCPLFEPFLEWLYVQDLADLSALPDTVNLDDAEFIRHGYRRQGRDRHLT
jgi:hypothetical protein